MKYFLFFFLTATNAIADTQLLLIGGGKRPVEAMHEFVSLAGGSKARILIIPWASASLEGSLNIQQELLATQFVDVKVVSLRPTVTELVQLRSAIEDCTGVFFSGGDQNKLMDFIKSNNLIKLFRQRFNQGVIFAGTSAGTAIMSDPMLSGEGSKLVPGLGLLPLDVIVDQHFIVRQRFDRLAAIVLDRGGIGIGVDENTSILLSGKHGQVIGPTQVLILERSQEGKINVNVLSSDMTFKLP